MKKTYKMVPFDIELVKKIQAGEIEGRIVTAEGEHARIICFDRKGFKDSILALITIDDSYEIDMFYTSDGKASKQSRFDIHIELPEETPKHEFKPFDKVLVRDNDYQVWTANLYSHTMYDSACPYGVFCGCYYKQCIPYEGNEHLVGTTDKPKEE